MSNLIEIPFMRMLFDFFGSKLVLFIYIIMFPFSESNAQIFDALSNPQVTVQINHPPSLGLKVNKIAFNTSKGNCSDQVITALISNFVANKIEVIDRENLSKVLAEHDLNLSGYIDQNKAVTMGKIIGPSALLSINVLRCQPEVANDLVSQERKYDAKTKQYYNVTAFISRTRVYLKASIQTTDLTTGRIFTARVLEYSPSYENKAYNGRPEAPAVYDVQEIALKYLVNDITQMFVPWTSQSLLYYYDDKEGGLKQAYQALKAGDTELAFNLSKQNLITCKANPEIKEKTLSHAYYNLGMSYMIRNEYNNALDNLNEAQKIKPGSIITESIAECEKAKKLALALQNVEAKASLEIAKSQAIEMELEAADKLSTLSNNDILDLTKKKIPVKLIMQKIKSSKCNFDTSTDALVSLTKAGVDEEVIVLMMEKK